MSFSLPPTLAPLSGSDDAAVAILRAYYGPRPDEPGFFTGSLFDTWDSSGTRYDDQHRFTADDLVAVTFLSVDVCPHAAYQLLSARAVEFERLLEAVDPETDLAELEEVPDAAWRVYQELRALDGVGPTTASKLLARKRPRLRPIYDSVVAAVTGTQKRQWEPVRQALRTDDNALHTRLLRLRDQAGLPDAIPALRVLDVIVWMDGKASTPT